MKAIEFARAATILTDTDRFKDPALHELEAPGRFAGNSAFHLEKAGVNPAGVYAPASRQQRHPIGVVGGDVRLTENRRAGRFDIIKAF